MTYWGFHLVFIIPVLLLIIATPPYPLAGALQRRWVKYLFLIALIAFVYTTPWDNYLVYRNVWWYGTERVLGVIGYVPIEEYLFFLLQPFLTGFWFVRVLLRHDPPSIQEAGRFSHIVGTAFYLFLAVAGYFLMQFDEGLYMGLILVWAAPVLAAQWGYAGLSIWALRTPFLVGVLVPTLYLWVADRIAIGLGIWKISEAYTLGWTLWGLPIEEATFFLVTNLLIVQGLILFLCPRDISTLSPTTSATNLHLAQ